MKSEQFEKRISDAQQSLAKWQHTYSLMANARLAIMLVALVLTYWIVTHTHNIGHVLLVVLAYAIFGVLIRQHNKIRLEINVQKAKININQDYLKRMTGEWQKFKDIGEEWIDFDHPYGMDLDIVGPKSLFQKINTTITWHGREKLAKALLEGIGSHEEILDRQKAIKELIHQLDYCQEIQYVGQKSAKSVQQPKALLAYMRQKECLVHKPLMFTYLTLIPWINASILGIGIVTNQMLIVSSSVLLMIGMYGSYVLLYGKIQSILGGMRGLQNQIDCYTELMKVIDGQVFSSIYLKKLQKVIKDKESGALEGMKQLEKICTLSSFTLQPLLAIPLNAFWLWDYKRIVELQKWRNQYGEHLEEWLEAIGELESLVSLAVLGQIEEMVCFPLITDENHPIDARGLGHPLLGSSSRISNDLTLQNEMMIITGSNMSGKTTFLRTIGINLVLAYTGSPVLADEMTTSCYSIYTSMRIKDDLQDGISTFYAELSRIKAMIEGSKTKPNALCLIDEIFRGTNSMDRISGAKSVLLGLQEQGAIGAITTHDLELCVLGKREGMSNYHFTEYYENDNIRFDYKLKVGPSTTTNAKYLMELVGIKIYK